MEEEDRNNYPYEDYNKEIKKNIYNEKYLKLESSVIIQVYWTPPN